MSAIESQITGVFIVCSTVGSGADRRKQQSSASLAVVRGIHRWPVNSPHKRPATRTMFPFDDVIMLCTQYVRSPRRQEHKETVGSLAPADIRSTMDLYSPNGRRFITRLIGTKMIASLHNFAYVSATFAYQNLKRSDSLISYLAALKFLRGLV